MRVILSVDLVRFPLTGVGRYTYELAKGLMQRSELESLKLFSGARFMEQLPVPLHESGGSHGLKRFVQKSAAAMELYRVLMPLIRSQRLRGYEGFTYHSPSFSLPPFPGGKIATIADLSAFKWPETQGPEKAHYLQKELRRTLDSADALIALSEYGRNELIEFAGWPPDRVHTVPLAAGPEFQPRGEQELAPFLKQKGLTYRGYTLFVGTIEPRKNLMNLLDAYCRLPDSVRRRWPLVLSGYSGWQSEAIHERIQRGEREGWLQYLGFLPAHELPLLYSGARMFVFPSLYEGFGLPVLEAMQSGVPVVCSDRASLPEVAGSGALRLEPEDVPGLSDSMRCVLQEDERRDWLIREGFEQSRRFSWAECVSGTLEAYRSINY